MIIGGIIIWSGAVIDIPTQYQLCDGTNGTPDLRNRFIVGAGISYAVDAIGGSDEHTHGFEGDGHEHRPLATHECPGSGASTAATVTPGNILTDNVEVSGTTDVTSELPPYYALAYIQRMP